MKNVILGLVCFLGVALSAAAQSPSGKGWRGEWVSDTSGHQGPLRANVKPLSNGDYRVRYAGRFAGIVPFFYPVTMHNNGTGSSGEVYLTNTSRLPFFGTFHADAVLTDSTFDSQFTSKKDSGRFILRR